MIDINQLIDIDNRADADYYEDEKKEKHKKFFPHPLWTNISPNKSSIVPTENKICRFHQSLCSGESCLDCH